VKSERLAIVPFFFSFLLALSSMVSKERREPAWPPTMTGGTQMAGRVFAPFSALRSALEEIEVDPLAVVTSRHGTRQTSIPDRWKVCRKKRRSYCIRAHFSSTPPGSRIIFGLNSVAHNPMVFLPHAPGPWCPGKERLLSLIV